MGVLSMTRIKLRSIRLLPAFLAQQEAAVKQLRSARGFIKGKALIDTSLGTWTLALWDSAEDMRAYYLSGAHRDLMPKLRDFACEAVTTDIPYDQPNLPSWEFVRQKLSSVGRFSTVLEKPSGDHLTRVIAKPKTTIFTRPIKAKCSRAVGMV